LKLYRVHILFLAILCGSVSQAQVWVTNGAHVVLQEEAHIVLDGQDAHYLNKNQGIITTNNGGTWHIDGNWINDGGNAAIGNNQGTVILTGGIQYIQGTHSTSFNHLILGGTDFKQLDVSTLVGGGYSGGNTGSIFLDNQRLVLNRNTLILNTNSPSALRYTGNAGILGETDALVGYGYVQWNLRDAPEDSVYITPFITQNGTRVPLTMDLNTNATQFLDSAFIKLATYPTDFTLIPNNRPLPLGVINLDNEFGLENDQFTLDRYFVIEDDGFRNLPEMALTFGYAEMEWVPVGGSRNTIDEARLKGVRYDFGMNSWAYPGIGTINTADNRLTTEYSRSYEGVWTLINTSSCPTANFTYINRCLNTPSTFQDSSFVENDIIDTIHWIFPNQEIADLQLVDVNLPTDGLQDVKLKVRSSRGCWDSITKQVDIYPLPVAAMEVKDTCFGDQTRFYSYSTTTRGEPLTNQWNVEGQPLSGDMVQFQYPDIGTKGVELVSTNIFGCADTIFQLLEIQPNPIADFEFEDICEEDLARFEDLSTSKGQIVSWDWFDGGVFIASTPIAMKAYPLTGNYPIELKVENEFGCRDSLTQNLFVKPKSRASFDFAPDEIYISNPTVSFFEQTIKANQFYWDFGDWSAEQSGAKVQHTYEDTGQYNVRLIANYDGECPDTAFRIIEVRPDIKIYIPNAFTPGIKDQVNSVFRPEGILHGLAEFEMLIYNRWGEKLYETHDINQPWDGSYMGALVHEGAYLYMIRVKDIYGAQDWYKGTVTVLR
jgi:gliding motility-associated-like protein